MIASAGQPHRGRFQAQGGRGKGIEQSEPWAQLVPLTAIAGNTLLDALYDKLGSAEQAVRQTAFDQARGFIESARASNGVMAPIRKSFPQKPNPHSEHVDVEVQKGIAFVP